MQPSPGWAPTKAPGARGGTGQDQARRGAQRPASGRTRTQRVPRTAGSQEGGLWGPQRHATCSEAPAAGTGREEEGPRSAHLYSPRRPARAASPPPAVWVARSTTSHPQLWGGLTFP